MMQEMQQTPQMAAQQTGELAAAQDASEAETGRVPDAGEPQAQAEQEFAALIAGKYRQAFARRTQEIIDRRFRKSKETEGRWQSLQPLLSEMRQRYGLAESDPQALLEAFRTDGQSGRALREKAGKALAFRGAMGQYVALLRQADALRQRYPGFDLPALCRDKRFTALLGAGMDMEQAYLSLHQQEVLRSAVAHTAQMVSQKVSAELAAQQKRPREGAMQAGSTAVHRSNPADLSRAQREAIARRVLKGEKIIL